MKKHFFVFSALAFLSSFFTAALSAQEAVSSKYKVSFYGLIKFDSIYDTHGIYTNDTIAYVASGKDSDRDFRVSARRSRLGFDVSDGADLSAKIETDFAGPTDASGSGDSLRIRHAYITYKTGAYEILAGQTWHLTPMELPGSNNEMNFGYSGALWSRVSQLRGTWKQSERLSVSAAIVRPNRQTIDGEGTASGLPLSEAQVVAKFGALKLTLAGAYGKWRNAVGQYGEVQLADLGFSLPYNIFTLNGQLWTGQNLTDFYGGIGQMGYGSREVKASGGFAALLIKPSPRYYFNTAWGIDNPVNSALTASTSVAATSSKTKNTTFLANANYVVNDRIIVTFETDYQTTQYKLTTGYKSLSNNHYQLSFKYPF